MSGTAVPAPWRVAVAQGTPPAPVVLVLGGFITAPPVYSPFVRRLLWLGAADVIVARVWTQDWLLAAGRGLGPILTRSGRALLEASTRAEVVSGGAPVLVIGHSAGGVSARILTSPAPFAGRPQRAAGRIGAIVTLGSPHISAFTRSRLMQAGADAAAFANREVPGTAFAPRTGYLAIASSVETGRRSGTSAERGTWELYRTVVGPDAADVIDGDGVVPLPCALLPGARSIVYPDAWHGQFPGREWYGSDRFVDDWWPTALEIWRAALRARTEGDAAGA